MLIRVEGNSLEVTGAMETELICYERLKMRKKKKWFVLGLAFLCIVLCYKSQVVSFYDKEFERAVRELMLSDCVSILIRREEPIRGPILRNNVKDVEDIFIDLNEYRITDMRDMKKFVGLKELDIGYIPADIETENPPNSDMPKNIDSICRLKSLERIVFFRINIDSGFNREQLATKELFIRNCVVNDNNFIKKFPEISLLVIDETEISSLEFLGEIPELHTLSLYNNIYTCSLEQLKLAHKLEILRLTSNKKEPFEKIPVLTTVKELYFRGEGSPRKAGAKKYLEWDSLEKLYLEGEQYDVATNTWSEN